MYLSIHSQSITFRCAHLAAAVSGNLWKSHWSRSGHTNRVKLQVAGVLHFVIQELSWCIWILPIKKSHRHNLQGKNIGGYERNQLKLKRGNSDLWKSEWHFPKHIMNAQSAGAHHTSVMWVNGSSSGETEGKLRQVGDWLELDFAKHLNISFKHGPSALMSNAVFLNLVTVWNPFSLKEGWCDGCVQNHSMVRSMHQFSLVKKTYTYGWRPGKGQRWAWDRNIVENIRHNHHLGLMAVGSEEEQELRLEVTDEIQKYVGSLRKMHCWICVAVSMEMKCSMLTYRAEYTGTSLELPR